MYLNDRINNNFALNSFKTCNWNDVKGFKKLPEYFCHGFMDFFGGNFYIVFISHNEITHGKIYLDSCTVFANTCINHISHIKNWKLLLEFGWALNRWLAPNHQHYLSSLLWFLLWIPRLVRHLKKYNQIIIINK